MKNLIIALMLVLLCSQAAECRPLIFRPFRLLYKVNHYLVNEPVQFVANHYVVGLLYVAPKFDHKLTKPLFFLMDTSGLATLHVAEFIQDVDSGLDFSTAESWAEYSRADGKK